MKSMRPTKAVINLSHLKYNFLGIRRKVKSVKVMAVVKADAYGHGVKEVCYALNSLKQKPEYFGVATAEEGAELRNLKIKQPVLVFEPVTKNEAGLVLKNNLTATVFEPRHLNILNSTGEKNKIIKVHVKVDTGMNRLGVHFNDAPEFVEKLSRLSRFKIDGIYTHFASSDEKDKSYAFLQLERFKKVLQKLAGKGIDYGAAHCANSGAILDLPGSYFDMVRPGISLYGYYPSLETSGSINLKPVMSVISEVNSVKVVNKGEGISYNRRYYTPKKTKIVSVPIGYADGFRRDLTNKAVALIKGKYYNQVGTVTMDRIMLDVGEESKIKSGDRVILLGGEKDKKIDAWDWGRILNTIPYEITCGISRRVKRVYQG